MATVNKDFKIKSGLIVEGTTATVNGHDVLTKKQADQDYIVSLIGGTATSENTPDTVVKRDGNGNFDAGTVSVNRINIGSVGYIEDDGSIEIVNTDGDDINISADDIRLQATDDVIISAGYDGSAAGDISLNTSGGVILLNSADVYVGSGEIDSERVATQGYVDQAETDAVTSANSHTDTALLDYTTTANLDAHIDGHLSGGDGISYSAGTISADVANGLEITDGHIVIDRDTVDTWYDAAGSADALINDASNLSTEVWSAYKTSTEIGLAQAAAELHADNAIADLVGSAPELLNTLEELATALENNPDIIADLENVAAGKQDTLTAGSNIDITGSTISVTGLDAADISDFNTAALAATAAAYDMYGAAASAQEAAEDYADGLAINYDAAGSASTAQSNAETFATNAINALDTDDIEEGAAQYFTDVRAKTSAANLLTGANLSNITITGDENGLVITAENGVAGSTTDDLAEGEDNLYFTNNRARDAVSGSNIQPESIDITWVRREEATWTDVPTASKATCHSAGTDEGSMKYLVRITASVGGTRHSHVTEVLATVDGSNGVAVVEYGTIYTSAEPLATVTVEWNASTSQYDLNVTTANNNSEVMVAATLMAALD